MQTEDRHVPPPFNLLTILPLHKQTNKQINKNKQTVASSLLSINNTPAPALSNCAPTMTMTMATLFWFKTSIDFGSKYFFEVMFVKKRGGGGQEWFNKNG